MGETSEGTEGYVEEEIWAKGVISALFLPLDIWKK